MTMSLEKIKQLRALTGAGIQECKSALESANGSIEEAIVIMRKLGFAKSVARSYKEAKEGVIRAKVLGSKAAIIEVNCESDFVSRGDKFQEFVNQALDILLTSNDLQAIEAKKQELVLSVSENVQVSRHQVIQGSSQDSVYVYNHGDKSACMLELDGCTNLELGNNIAMQIVACQPTYVDELPSEVIKVECQILESKHPNKPAKVMEMITSGALKTLQEEQCLLHQRFFKDSSVTIKDMLQDCKVIKFFLFAKKI